MTPVELFEANTLLVPWTMRRYFPYIPQGEWDDVESTGRIGLWKAATYFDESKGFTFATLAVGCIRNEIHKDLRRRQNLSAVPHDKVICLDATLGPETASTYADTLADEGDLEELVERREMLRVAHEDPVMALMLDKGLTPKEATRELGMSYKSVRSRWKKRVDAVKEFQPPPRFKHARRPRNESIL